MIYFFLLKMKFFLEKCKKTIEGPRGMHGFERRDTAARTHRARPEWNGRDAGLLIKQKRPSPRVAQKYAGFGLIGLQGAQER